MTYEADRHINTMLALLQQHSHLEAPGDPPPSSDGWRARYNRFWGDTTQLRADIKSLEAQLATAKKQRDDAIAEAFKAGVDRDNALRELAQLKAEIAAKKADIAAKKAQQEAQQRAAWEAEKAQHRRAQVEEQRRKNDQLAAESRARDDARRAENKAREEAEAERLRNRTAAEKLADLEYEIQKEAKAAYFMGIKYQPSDDEVKLLTELTAQVEAEEREKIRVRKEAEEAETEEEKQNRLAKERHDDFWFAH